VLIYLFRDEGTDNLALTVDVHRPEYSTHHAFDGLAFRRGDRHTEISPTVGSNRFPMLAAPAEGGRFLSIRGGC